MRNISGPPVRWMTAEVPHQTSALRKSLKAFALLHCAKVLNYAQMVGPPLTRYALRRVNKWLNGNLDQTASRPVEINDQHYHYGERYGHDQHGKEPPGSCHTGVVTGESHRHHRNADQHQRYLGWNMVAQRCQPPLMDVVHFVQRGDEAVGRQRLRGCSGHRNRLLP